MRPNDFSWSTLLITWSSSLMSILLWLSARSFWREPVTINSVFATSLLAFSQQWRFSILNPFQSRNTRSNFFLDLLHAPQNYKDARTLLLQTAKHSKPISKHKHSVRIFFSIVFARRKIIKKERTLYLQTAKHSKLILKQKHSVRIFFSIFCARRKIIKMKRTLFLQTAKHSKPISKQKHSVRIFFMIFCARRKIIKVKERYYYKLQSILNSFQSRNTRSNFFLDLLRAPQNYKDERTLLLQTAKHSKPISKHKHSVRIFFSIVFARRKIIKKERTLYLQTAKHSKLISKQKHSVRIFFSIFCACRKIIKMKRTLFLQTAKHSKLISK